MGNFIKVSVPKMKHSEEELQACIEKIPQFIHELTDSLRKLGACWEGPACVMFQQQIQSDILNLLEMYDWLSRFLQKLSEGGTNYGICEEKCFDCIDKIRI